MKYTNLLFISCLLVVFTVCNDTHAQEKEDATQQKQLHYLTVEQQLLLKQQQELLDKTRAVFKENLTEEQLQLLTNGNISKQERIRLLNQSLSQEQRDLISANRIQLQSKKELFRKSLSIKQKLKLRRFISNKKIDDRRRLARRLRRLIRDNIDR